MTNDAWLDDPDLRVHDSDDPDSRALKKGLSLIFWPRPTLLIVGWLIAIIFDLGWASGLLMFATCLWLGAHLLFRPSRFFGELRAVGDYIAEWLSKAMRKLNRAAKQEPQAPSPTPEPQAFAALAPGPNRPTGAAPELPAPAPKPTRIDWGKLGRALLNPWFWVIVGVLCVGVMALRGFDFFQPSGREVAADARADVAEANESTANAETEQMAAALARVEAAATRLDRLTREAERARHAIQNAPDLDSGIAAHSEYVGRLRGDAAAERAAAVSDFGASIDP